MQFVLASASPRRKSLMQILLGHFECAVPCIDETLKSSECPQEYVLRLAEEKARVCWKEKLVVFGADTSVVLDCKILGKPQDKEQAKKHLASLSGRTHEVHTGIAIWDGRVLSTRHVRTEVDFVDLTSAMIERYLETGEIWGKAGGYAIQGYAGSFVRAIRGSYSSVVGLPLCETRELLMSMGLIPVDG